MSQIDKIIYLPLLFWFIILLFVLYFIIFNYFLTVFLTILKVRIFYYKDIKTDCIRSCIGFWNIFLKKYLFFLYINFLYKNISNKINLIKNV